MKTTKKMETPRQHLGIGKIIKIIRQKRRLTQQQLGEKINVSKSYISKIEAGKQQPNADQLKKISEVLKVSTYFLKHINLRTEDLSIDDDKIKEMIIDKYNEINEILASQYFDDGFVLKIVKADEDRSENEDMVLESNYH